MFPVVLPLMGMGLALLYSQLIGCGGKSGKKGETLPPNEEDCEDEDISGTRRWDLTENPNSPYTKTELDIPKDIDCEIPETSYAKSSFDSTQALRTNEENYTALHIEGQTKGCEFAKTSIIFGDPVNPNDPFDDDGIFSVPVPENLENLKFYIKPEFLWGNEIDGYKETTGWINFTLVVDNSVATGRDDAVNVFNVDFPLKDNEVWKGYGIRKSQFILDEKTSNGNGVFDLTCHSGGLYEIVVSIGCNPLEEESEQSSENHGKFDVYLDLLRLTDQKISPMITTTFETTEEGLNDENALEINWEGASFNDPKIDAGLTNNVFMEQPNWETTFFSAENQLQKVIPYEYLPTGIANFYIQTDVGYDLAIPTYSLPVPYENKSFTSLLNGFENNGIWTHTDDESTSDAFGTRFINDPVKPSEFNHYALQITGTDANNNGYIGTAGFTVNQPIYGSTISLFIKLPQGTSNSVRLNIYLTAVEKASPGTETFLFGLTSPLIIENQNWQEYKIPLENFVEFVVDEEGNLVPKEDLDAKNGDYLINNADEILGSAALSPYPDVGGQRSFIVNMDHMRQIP